MKLKIKNEYVYSFLEFVKLFKFVNKRKKISIIFAISFTILTSLIEILSIGVVIPFISSILSYEDSYFYKNALNIKETTNLNNPALNIITYTKNPYLSKITKSIEYWFVDKTELLQIDGNVGILARERIQLKYS
jgi:hypothetical protein